MNDHQRQTLERIARMPITPPPLPWREIPAVRVGGLRHVGFHSESELLLVESSSGKGVIDCRTGERVARDDSEQSSYEQQLRLIATGIGPLAGKTLRMSGLFGGGLLRCTADQWSFEHVLHEPPHNGNLILQPPGAMIWVRERSHGCSRLCETEDDVRAHGFSWTGQSLLLAYSHTLLIWSRG